MRRLMNEYECGLILTDYLVPVIISNPKNFSNEISCVFPVELDIETQWSEWSFCSTLHIQTYICL